MMSAMKKIAVITSSRAEYGLLSPIIKKLLKKEILDVRIVATGSHLAPEFGYTIKEIEKDGIPIDRRIEILMASDSPASVSKTMGLAMISFAEYYEETKPDAVLVLGDRYELLAFCSAALNAQIPIIHLYGGETTEGAIDEAIRHSITKMASLHFTANESYRKRVIQLGEDPEKVFAVGAMGPENALSLATMSRKDLENALSCSFSEHNAVLTFHPVTLEKDSAKDQVEELIQAIEKFPDIHFFCTRANADVNGRIINTRLSEYANSRDNIFFYDSMGSQKYLSLVREADFVIGNSSSGLSEVPSLGVPTVNIGDRQKGRERGPSVIDCEPRTDAIVQAIRYALSPEMKAIAQRRENPYGDGHTSSKIADIVESALIQNSLSLKKKFYDIDFEL